MSANDLLKLYEEMDGLLVSEAKKEVMDQCDERLKTVDVENTPTELLVGYLRITFPARTKIPFWSTLLERAVAECSKRKLDTGKLFRGLQ